MSRPVDVGWVFRPEALRAVSSTGSDEPVAEPRDHRPRWASWWTAVVLLALVVVLADVPVEDRLPVVATYGSAPGALCPAPGGRVPPQEGRFVLWAAGRGVEVTIEGPDLRPLCGPGRPAVRLREDVPGGPAVLVTGARSVADRVVGSDG